MFNRWLILMDNYRSWQLPPSWLTGVRGHGVEYPGREVRRIDHEPVMVRIFVRWLALVLVAIGAAGSLAASVMPHEHSEVDCAQCSHASPGRRRFIEQAALSQEQLAIATREIQAVSKDVVLDAAHVEHDVVEAQCFSFIPQVFAPIQSRAPPIEQPFCSAPAITQCGRAPPVC